MNSTTCFQVSRRSVTLPKTTVRHAAVWPRRRTPLPEQSGHPPNWGEEIWVWSNMMSNQIVYSHSKTLDISRAMRQLPFIAKKSKPAKIRKDLWRPMALIQFPKGAGAAGQSAFQKLREFRRRHELEWDDDKFFVENEQKDPEKPITKRMRTRKERGFAIHDQRANAIADMAAVLSGHGKGSRLWISQSEKETMESGEKELRGRKWDRLGPGSDSRPVPEQQLIQAKVFWVDENDRNFASEWSENVTHKLLKDDKGALPEDTEPIVETAVPVEGEPAQPEAESSKKPFWRFW